MNVVNQKKFKIANATLVAAIAMGLSACSDDDSSNSSTIAPQSSEYVADKGFHITPTAAIFSGKEQPIWLIPENALTPVVTSDLTVRTTEERKVVQFTSGEQVGLVAGFDLAGYSLAPLASLSDSTTFEFDLRLVGTTNRNTLPDAVNWAFKVHGENAEGEVVSVELALPKAASNEWQHYVITKQQLLDANAELAIVSAISVYPDSSATIYNVDNVAIYPEYKDSEGPVLVLNGDTTITQLNYPDAVDQFEDPGFTVSDNQDDATEIVVEQSYGETGEVDADVNGTYQITYNSSDTAGNVGKPITRTVIIEAAPDIEDDVVAPVITLNGAANMRVALGGTYTEPGATAIDAVDGEIDVIITGSVDVNTLGTYTLTYTATDKSDNSTDVTRSVEVFEQKPIENIVTNGDFAAGFDENWVVEEGSAKAEVVDGALVISDYTPGAPWQPRLVQGNIKLEPGLPYILSFDAKSGEARNIMVQLGEKLSSDPWFKPFTDDTHVGLTPEMKRHTITFVASENAANVGHLLIGLGGGVSTPVTLDNIELVLQSDELIPPVITLNGGGVRMGVGETYQELGATALDNTDGDLTASIVITGDDFDTSVPGNHVVTYSVTDSDSNTAEVTRQVSVVADSNNLVTNGDFSAGFDYWLTFGGLDANGEFIDGALKFSQGVLKQERFAEGAIKNGDVLEVSFKYKAEMTEGQGGVFKVGLHAEMPTGSDLPPKTKWTEYWDTTTEWKTETIEFVIDNNAETLSIEMLVAGGVTPTVWLDDIVIKHK
ncbi:immunoglobulin-like domain-containing protein [Vibrio alfacsensis]|uniref:immunoglobulin-like domain-containing protein n=1 Tax=Vibrio alfacsensis TaxID=1074311 RepID=UPI004067C780